METMEIDGIVECYTDSEIEQYGHDVSDTFDNLSFRIFLTQDLESLWKSNYSRFLNLKSTRLNIACERSLHVTLPSVGKSRVFQAWFRAWLTSLSVCISWVYCKLQLIIIKKRVETTNPWNNQVSMFFVCFKCFLFILRMRKIVLLRISTYLWYANKVLILCEFQKTTLRSVTR